MGGFREISGGGGILTFGRPLGDGSATAFFFFFGRTESGNDIMIWTEEKIMCFYF